MMLTGVVLEGLQDLLVQYLQLKLDDFGVKDVVRGATGGARACRVLLVCCLFCGWVSGARAGASRCIPFDYPPKKLRLEDSQPTRHPPPALQSHIFMIFGACGLVVQTLLLRPLLK